MMADHSSTQSGRDEANGLENVLIMLQLHSFVLSCTVVVSLVYNSMGYNRRRFGAVLSLELEIFSESPRRSSFPLRAFARLRAETEPTLPDGMPPEV